MLEVEWFHERMHLVKRFAREVEVEEVVICFPLEYKTAAMAYELSKHVDVTVVRMDASSTREEAVEWLKSRGVEVARKRDVADRKYFLDCAAVMSGVAISRGRKEITVVELTKTGEERLIDMMSKCRIKAISVDNSSLKGDGENVYGTAFGLLDVLMRLNIYPPGKRVAVVGYGRVGRGCAKLLRRIGCEVVCFDAEKRKLVDAVYDGMVAGRDARDLGTCDIIITCTGRRGVIGQKELENVKDGAILINLGAEAEITIRGEILKDYGDVKKYGLNGKSFYVVADGYAANLSMGYGSPVEVMDRTFSAAILSLNELERVEVGVHPLPHSIEERILNALRLESFSAENYSETQS